MSLPEVMLWQRLRDSPDGLRFRRQHPIGPYVVDFYCAAARLVIEVDGQAHDCADVPIRDAERNAFLEQNRYDLLRLSAAVVLKDADEAAASIVRYAVGPLHHDAARRGPPPRAGEDCR